MLPYTLSPEVYDIFLPRLLAIIIYYLINVKLNVLLLAPVYCYCVNVGRNIYNIDLFL